jgi:hypothetical protein
MKLSARKSTKRLRKFRISSAENHSRMELLQPHRNAGPDCRRLRDVELLLAKEKGGRQCDGQLLKSKSSKPKPELDASPVWRKLEGRSQRRGR